MFKHDSEENIEEKIIDEIDTIEEDNKSVEERKDNKEIEKKEEIKQEKE